jgi:hypothetical protein
MKKILNIATFGLAGALLKPFGKDKKKEEPAATPTPERVMPLADDEAIRRAKSASIIRQTGRSGRASTILTSPGSTLGG